MKSIRRPILLVAVSLAATTLSVTAAAADEAPVIVNTAAPRVDGVPRYLNTLSATAGSWSPEDVALSYQWVRNGAVISGATKRTYRLGENDLSKKISVRVTAQRAGSTTVKAFSGPTTKVETARIKNVKRPRIIGSLKYTKYVKAYAGKWSVKYFKVSYRWTSDGKAIAGATKKKYRLTAADVGKRMRVVVKVAKSGHKTRKGSSPATGAVKHLVAVKRTVNYRVETRGSTRTSLKTFRSLANETLNDARGWRGTGIAFKEVKSGGSMTLVLSQASRVPSFSSGCSSTYSCRVGRYVIINADRWRGATPSWNRAKGSLRNYRHMVVNHETGHWLGHGHRSCGGRRALAPVMQQQSISLGGCNFNSWPKASERYAPRFGIR